LKKRFDIEILGQEVSVLTDRGDEYVKGVVDYINERAKEIGEASKEIPKMSVAILLALNMADELFLLRREKAFAEKELEEKFKDLILYIENRVSKA
jgi:cell division protein ZapA